MSEQFKEVVVVGAGQPRIFRYRGLVINFLIVQALWGYQPR
jgi:hypothetical protein